MRTSLLDAGPWKLLTAYPTDYSVPAPAFFSSGLYGQQGQLPLYSFVTLPVPVPAAASKVLIIDMDQLTSCRILQ